MTPQDNSSVLVVLTTCPSPDVAEGIAADLVTAGLAACVNQLPGVRSTYIWKGKVETADEVLLVIKTTQERFEPLKARIAAIHPYELPELIALPVCAGTEKYLEWVRHSVK